MKKITSILLLLIAFTANSQIKFTQLERAASSGSAVVTGTNGALTFTGTLPTSVVPALPLSQILTAGNTTGGQPILSDNGYSSTYSNDTKVGYEYDDGGSVTGLSNITTLRAAVKHSDLIELDAPSVKKNGVEVATLDNLPYVTPEMYGAVGDGSTNDAAAIQSAINTGSLVIFGAKNYRITSTLILAGNTKLLGSGKSSIISTTSNILMVNCQSSYNTITGISFIGNSTGGSQTAIFADGVVGLTNAYVGNIISECYFINLGNSGIGTRYNIGTSFPTNTEGCFTISDCIFDGCTTGINFLVRGEYNTVTNCKIYRCTTGFSNTGGNNSMTGGHITQCTTGVSLLGGTNDGHASFANVKINHNTTNINANALTSGYVFNGCMFYGGNITIVNSPRIRFIGCNLSSLPTITCTNSSEVFFINCEFVTNPTLTITGTRPTFERCRYVAGCPSNQLRDGEATLASGTITVANISTTSNTRIYLTRRTIGSAPGNLTYTITAGTSFTINSDNASDNGIIEWQLLEKTN